MKSENSLIGNIMRNWKSGLTVALVSIPLSLALAIASGATPTQGIITAFWAGIIGATLGGSKFNIIGPTGALSGILVGFALIHGYQMLPIIAILSGIIMFVFYLLHFDKYIIFIPRSVVHGFTLGVAFIIAFGQLDNMFGLAGIEKTDSFVQNILITLQNVSVFRWEIFAIFIIATFFIFIWDKKFPKFPGSIVIAFLGIIAVIVLQQTNTGFELRTIANNYPDIKAALYQNFFPSYEWSIFLNKDVWIISFATAIIGILETLISGQIAQVMTKTPFNRSKEIFSLSLANIGSGLMGGIPATAALARTALNIKSGAKERTSGIIASIFLGIITLFMFYFFKQLPVVIIAAILFALSLRMIETRHFIRFIENERVSFFLSLFVAITTVAEDPIVGILVGTFIALLIFVNKVSFGQTEVLIWKDGQMRDSFLKTEIPQKEDINSDLVVYKISGTLTYINMPAHIEAVRRIQGNKYVIISMRHAFYADLDGIEYLKELIEILKVSNEKVYLSGINSEIRKLVEKEDFYKQKLIENKIFKRTSEAINEIYKK